MGNLDEAWWPIIVVPALAVGFIVLLLFLAGKNPSEILYGW